MSELDLRPWIDRTTFDVGATELRLGVSGGADSLALLALASTLPQPVTVVHVDHGQRPTAASERDFVAEVCASLGAQFVVQAVSVDPGSNLEARLRAARYGVLGADAATGHTADDQAETVLINLLRGAGLRGLGAMRPGPRRPILALRRQDTDAICAEMGWKPLVDPSNDDRRFIRNRIRHELLPLLTDIAGRDVVPLLSRTADHARSGIDFIDDAAQSIDPTDARAVAAAPGAVAAAAIATWVRNSTASDHPIDTASIERIIAVASGDHVAAEVSGGWRVSRSGQRMAIT